MIRLFVNAAYDFLGKRRWAYGITAAFVLPGLVLLALTGLNYSIEFTGGTFVHVRTVDTVGTAAIRSALAQGGITDAEISTFGSPVDYSIKARLSPGDSASETSAQAAAEAVRRALTTTLGAQGFEILQREAVGPKVGQELQTKALLAILASFAAVLVYLAVRFEWRFGLAAVLATAHDIVATIAFVRYFELEVSLVLVAGILTVLGYSLNDTIVIFDRVRENLRSFRRQHFGHILNLSINETLPRTVLTGGTAILMALTLAIFAGEVIRPFALVMSFGIVTGTFSSIFIASPILQWIERRWPGTDARGARLLMDDRTSNAPLASSKPSSPVPPPSRPVGGRAR